MIAEAVVRRVKKVVKVGNCILTEILISDWGKEFKSGADVVFW